MNNKEQKAQASSVAPALQQTSVSRSLSLLANVPQINKEILLFAKTKTKDEVLKAYPNHAEFINTIQGF